MGKAGFGPSGKLATKHTSYEMCLPSQKGMTMTMNIADPVQDGSYSGKCVVTPPKPEPPIDITIPDDGGPVIVIPPKECTISVDCPTEKPICTDGTCKPMSCAGGGFTMDG